MSSSYDNLRHVGTYDGDDSLRRRSRRRIIIISLCTVAILAIVIGAVVAARSRGSDETASEPVIAGSIKAVCTTAENPDSCYRTLMELSNGESITLPNLYKLSARLTMSELRNSTRLFARLRDSGKLDEFNVLVADDCVELLDMAVDALNDTLVVDEEEKKTRKNADDFRTWLSAVMTYQETCLGGFENASSDLKSEVNGYIGNSSELASDTLAIMTFLAKGLESAKGLGRKLLQVGGGNAFPSSMTAAERRLLQADVDPRKASTIVVDKNGTGDYRSINKALESVPEKSEKRTIIYVKKGEYAENVEVAKKKYNVMIVGDGKEETVITGSLNYVDGTSTYRTATLAVKGRGFLGRDFTVRNTAGPEKHQAVAMMSGSDDSAFYRMKFDAYQDTLYPHSMRQFYRECDIYGTVDFIFGDAAVVLQNCTIRPRVPMKGQKCMLTAQGKKDRNEVTGISIHNCTVLPFGNLTGVDTYLGRPWKKFSTTVFMKTELPGIIHPKGWLEWTSGVEPPKTIFYGEYENTGPGAKTSGRVRWAGVRKLGRGSAEKFTVEKFISGSEWLPETKVPFYGGL